MIQEYKQTRDRRSWTTYLKYVIFGVLALLVTGLILGYLLLRGSLPLVDGSYQLVGLKHPVKIERDHLGIPSIFAEDRIDLARAIGYLHGQERYFQLDLQRRAAAGELAALLGPSVLHIDKKHRLHQFRKRSQTVLKSISPQEMEVIKAYTEGVNAGFNALSVRPFEYLILQQEPKSWSLEDNLLVAYSLFIALQDPEGTVDISRGLIHTFTSKDVYDFVINNGSKWEAAMDGSTTPMIPIPAAEAFKYLCPDEATTVPVAEPVLGASNHWAVDGSRTEHGGGMMACDMHLALNVPIIWYRATFHYKDENGEPIEVHGATFPGTPCMTIGSNTHVAWGFTNGYIDTSDIVLLNIDPNDPNRYLTPDGYVPFEVEQEQIEIKGQSAQELEVRKTIWGPVLPWTINGKPIALLWVAHRPDSLNIRLTLLEKAKSVQEALDFSNEIKTPVLSMIVADRQGNIGWGLVGELPKRHGFNGTLPVDLSTGEMYWDGVIDRTKDYPQLINPSDRALWAANNRMIGGKWGSLVGTEGFMNGIRAYQIEKRLEQLQNSKVNEKTMLAMQLDDEAPFFRRWQELLLKALKPSAEAGNAIHAKVYELVADWDGHSHSDSQGYYWVRSFRDVHLKFIMGHLLQPCAKQWSGFELQFRELEEPLWKVVSEQPDYLVFAPYHNWQEQILGPLDAQIAEMKLTTPEQIAAQHWGAHNRLLMQHPISKAIPPLGRLLDMPYDEQSGDLFMPRVSRPKVGASQRMVVAPGFEEDGIFQLPGGQSGNPLSPHYRDSYRSWYEGAPAPLLPGPAVHTLILHD